VTDVNGTVYTYDDNGNLTSNGAHSYAWDERNRLSSSESKTFYYNAGGSRYKTVDSSSGTDEYTYYVSPLYELRDGTSADDGTPTYYIFAGGQRVAALEDSDADGNLENSERSYYVQDHLGGTALVTDSTGIVTQLYDYYPYGSELLDSQPTGADAPSEHSFTDKELDEDLGLYYFEARWYDSSIGRFSSQDPAQLDGRVSKLIQDPQSLNFYAYSRNNPVNLVDVTGEDHDEPTWWQNVLEYAPITGDIADAYTIITGETPFTHQEVSGWNYAVTVVATVLGGLTGPEARGIKNGVVEIAENLITKNVDFSYGTKIRGQIKGRGWDGNSVQETLNNPYKTVETTDYRYNNDGTRMDNPATAYINEDGSYVVRNDNTGDIVQISDKTDLDWKSPFE